MSGGRELTALVDEVFRLADAFAAAGDRLVAGESLTSARWLTLGAVAHGPLSVAGIARRRGMRRQSAAESVGALERAGLVRREPDPDDARAPLVHLTAEGRATLERIRPVRQAWADETARVSTPDELAQTTDVLRRLRNALD
ncbi:MarR family winged helix-turn-helix transcriptional regulator [Leifsonia poae]|uniref:MarR family winged helix-turn-helix transcriptional regulator n=1 Tax=Leifsonia poae TaxID=110933 RepID=UPI003D688606